MSYGELADDLLLSNSISLSDDQERESENSSNITLSYNNGDDAFVYEFLAFKQFLETLFNVLHPCEIALLAFGFIGNLLAFITLLQSKRMCTPSFLYHRALVAADLIFCINFFANLFIAKITSVDCNRHIFRYRLAAVYSGTIYPLINSVSSYALSYATSAVTLDRLMALTWLKSYQRWNRRNVAIPIIFGSLILSLTVHSWAAFIQHTVIEYRLDHDANDTLIWRRCWTDKIVYHWVIRDHMGEAYNRAIEAKRIYNAAFRITYPLLLACMTLGIVASLITRAKRKRRLRRSAIASALPAFTKNVNPAARRRYRCEKALLFLTISVLILAFLQVAASEGRRILQFAFPAAEIIRTKVNNPKLPLENRLINFRRVLYSHQVTRVFANFFTVLERSAICVLYIATNELFRGELLLMITSIFARFRFGTEFRKRFDSNARGLNSDKLRRRKKTSNSKRLSDRGMNKRQNTVVNGTGKENGLML